MDTLHPPNIPAPPRRRLKLPDETVAQLKSIEELFESCRYWYSQRHQTEQPEVSALFAQVAVAAFEQDTTVNHITRAIEETAAKSRAQISAIARQHASNGVTKLSADDEQRLREKFERFVEELKGEEA